MKKVSKKDLVLLAVILAAFSVFVVPKIVFHNGVGTRRAASTQYYCPMHPTYTSDRPGDCPICNMKLVPKPDAQAKKERKILYYRHPMGQPDASPVPKKDSMGMDYIPVYEDELSVGLPPVAGHAGVRISLEKQQLIGVKLGSVEKRAIKKEIRTTGRVAFDPELYTAQREFISAVESVRKAKTSPYHEPLKRNEELVGAAKTRLRLLGMSESEIAELEQSPVQDKNLILPTSLRAEQSEAKQSIAMPHPEAPKGPKDLEILRSAQDDRGSVVSPSSGSLPRNDNSVWIYGTVYEYELPFVQIGSQIKVRIPTISNKEFTGEVRALDPVLDAGTRSIRLRARVENPEGILRPEMYVDVYLESDLGETLAVPEEAVMQTGERAIVFVSKGEGMFEPREVTVGTKAGDFYEVKSGLAVGEQVVVNGNFLIDSESRLQAALEGMGSGGGHQHGA